MSNDSAQRSRAGGVEPNLARHGKLSYIQIPAADTAVSADFYRGVFGWSILNDSPAHRSFADASGELIGAFVTGRTIAAEAGHLPYIYVEGIDAAVSSITSNGGEIVAEPYAEGGLWVATFRDPAGNLLGIWQQGPR
jgi:predicted enzyme related to lactoylglutathione lyase